MHFYVHRCSACGVVKFANVRDSCGLLCGCLELKMGSLEEQPKTPGPIMLLPEAPKPQTGFLLCSVGFPVTLKKRLA